MPADAARLIALAEAVADGRTVDWGTESGSLPAGDRSLVDELRLLAGVGEVHRSAATTVEESLPPELTSQHWGPLEIRGRIGSGQFGTVYQAWDPRLEREVALKLLHRRPVGSETLSRTLQEGRLLGRVRHPHVVTVFGADEIDGRIGVWMDLVHGSTLEAVFRGHGAFSAREAALIGIDLCGALAAVHQQGLVHRDVKAQNVMREAGGRILLMDFGSGEEVSPRLQDGRITGTPLYMAPELFAAGEATPRSDIYSLGVLLFWLTTGSYPVAGRTVAEVRSAHERGERRKLRDVRPDLEPGFVDAVERAVAADPSHRYATAGELEDALRDFVAERRAWDPARRAAHRRRRLTLIAAAATVAVVAIAGATVWRGREPSPAPAAPALASIRSVMVSGFVNLSGDANNDAFAAGLSDLLESRLGSVRALRVVTDSTPSARRPSPSPETLGVDGVISGSVDRRGNELRVNVKLLHARSNALLWSESYERPLDEAFALQGQIARDLASEFRLTLSDEERTLLNQAYRPQPQAQDAYFRARVLMHRQEREALVEARRLLEDAVGRDPGYQLAHAALARCYVALEGLGVLSPPEAAPLARTSAMAALAIDDNAEAQLALARVAFGSDWDWAGAEAAFRRALQLNPSLSEARNYFSRFLSAAGRTQESIEQARHGLEVDPLSLEMHEALAMALYYDRKPAEALKVIHSIASIGEQSPTILGRLHSALGDQATAAKYINDAHARNRTPALLAEIGRIAALSGGQARARTIVDELRRRRESGDGYVFPGDIAFVLIALGAHEEALLWLERAVDERGTRPLWLRVDPRVDPVRTSPRFQQLLRRIGP